MNLNASKVTSPFGKSELELEKVINKENYAYEKTENNQTSDVSKIVGQKRVLSKIVEITTTITFTFEDGSIQETLKKECHTFAGDNL